MKARKLLALILACLCMLSLWSCKQEQEGDSEQTVVTSNISEWTIVYSQSSVAAKKLAENLRDSIKGKSGVELSVRSDYEADSDQKEILVDDTNRALSATALEKATDVVFCIEKQGNKIAINTSFDSLFDRAFTYFVATYVDGTQLNLPETMSYVSEVFDFIRLISDRESDYRIIYSENADPAVKELVNTLVQDIHSIGHAYVSAELDTEIKVQDDNACEILIGKVNRAACDSVYDSLDYSDYAVSVSGNRIILAGWSHLTIKLAVNKFTDIIRSVADEKNTLIDRSLLDITGASSYFGKADVPDYTDGEVSAVYNCNDDVIQLFIPGTTAAGFQNYRRTLEASGYTLYSENSFNSNLYAVYNHQAKQQSIFLSYTAFESVTKITVSPKEEMLSLTPENPDTKLSKTRFTCLAVGDNGDGTNNGETANGTSIVITLEDGRFVIIDGGTNVSSEVERIYNFISENKPSSHDKPVIAAWILTHPDGDHWGAMYGFSQKYAGKVTLEKIIYNIFDSSVQFDMKESAQSAGDNVHNKIVPEIASNLKCNTLIKVHTGQKFYIGNALFEVLYTHEDLYPEMIGYTNDSSIVFMLTLGGKKFLLTADMEGAAARQLNGQCASYLKCDYIQIMHHGWPGAKSDQITFNCIQYNNTYDLADAGYALWTVQLSRVQQIGSGRQMLYVKKKFAADKILSTENGNIVITFG